MRQLTKILLICIVIFLTGCDIRSTLSIKRDSKVEDLLTIQNMKESGYTLKKTANGVYIYTDKPKAASENAEPDTRCRITN